MRPTRGPLWCLLLSLIGVALSGYLFFLHLGLLRGELLGGPVCSGARMLNCHAVTSGTWGSFLGMPLALWGMLGYAAVFSLALLGQQSAAWAETALTLIFVLAIGFVAIDVVLLTLMVAVIRFYCVFCLLTYGVNVTLLAVSGASPGQRWGRRLNQLGPACASIIPSAQHREAGLFWGMVFLGGAGIVGIHAATFYTSRGTFGSTQQQIREFLTKQPRVSVETTGDPAIGPADAPVQMIEFSDFFCPACQRASKFNTIMLASHRQDTRFIFKNYPLDTTCNTKIFRMVHPGACTAAAAAECANLQGKFWPFHDLLFQYGHQYNVANLESDAQRLGLNVQRFRECMASGEGMEAVKRDIAEGEKIGVTSTPTYVINGAPLAGGVHPAMFDDLVAVLKEKKE